MFDPGHNQNDIFLFHCHLAILASRVLHSLTMVHLLIHKARLFCVHKVKVLILGVIHFLVSEQLFFAVCLKILSLNFYLSLECFLLISDYQFSCGFDCRYVQGLFRLLNQFLLKQYLFLTEVYPFYFSTHIFQTKLNLCAFASILVLSINCFSRLTILHQPSLPPNN